VLETQAYCEALPLADDPIQTRILVASDCKPLVDDILDGTMRRYGAVFTEIKARLHSYRTASSFSKGEHQFFKITT
jgi:hypothetical protein